MADVGRGGPAGRVQFQPLAHRRAAIRTGAERLRCSRSAEQWRPIVAIEIVHYAPLLDCRSAAGRARWPAVGHKEAPLARDRDEGRSWYHPDAPAPRGDGLSGWRARAARPSSRPGNGGLRRSLPPRRAGGARAFGARLGGHVERGRGRLTATRLSEPRPCRSRSSSQPLRLRVVSPGGWLSISVGARHRLPIVYAVARRCTTVLSDGRAIGCSVDRAIGRRPAPTSGGDPGW